MKLYVVRHAIAVEPDGRPDQARPLSPEGRERFEEVARGMERLGWRFDRIVHSPLLRAVQTAELLVPLLQGATQVSANLARKPSEALLEELKGERVAVVGHEPWTSELVAWLVTGDRKHRRGLVFRKGGVAVVEGSARPGEARLLGLHSPKVLRPLGR